MSCNAAKPASGNAVEGNSAIADSSKLFSVTATYHPDVGVLRRQLMVLPAGMHKIIVDNGSPTECGTALRTLATEIPNATLFLNPENLGLAAALNQGVSIGVLVAPDAEYLLLLDQDTVPRPCSLERQLAALRGLQQSGVRVGAVGPQLSDPDTGMFHGFHQLTLWRWRRVFPPIDAAEPIPVANLNGSGTLMPVAVFRALGGLDADLFIDHVDTEWSFRLRAAGYALMGVPNAIFDHRMGQRGLRYWLFGWRVWPVRRAVRHRYLFRNALWLMRRSYVPLVWKVWATLKLLLTVIVHGVFDPERGPQLRAMGQGLRDGLTGRVPHQ